MLWTLKYTTRCGSASNAYMTYAIITIILSPQGHLNSCTANALSQIWRYAQSRVDPGFNPSRLFIYYNERSAEGTASQDSGAYLSDGCRSLKTYGVCSEWTWPYEESNEPVKPPQDAYDEALDHIIHTPCQLSSNLSTLKDSLAQEKPFVVGISVYEEFLSDHATKYGNVEMPGPGSQHKFNHAVTCVGYDDDAQEWIFRNSWGPDWGCNG